MDFYSDAEFERKYVHTGAEIKGMNKEYPWNGTIINANSLDDRKRYTLEFAGHGGWSGSLTRAVPYEK